jgi:hypothetical protein
MRDKSAKKPDRSVQTRGGYPAGDKLVTDLAPPPKGPGPGAKPKGQLGKVTGKSGQK